MEEMMVLNSREFQVLKLLGRGKGGYSYLVTDGISQFVLKQIHHESCDYYQFGDKLASELRDYKRLRTTGIPLPRLLEVDTPRERLLKEYIQGDTVDVLVKENRMEPDYYAQIGAICQAVYAAGLNIDYYPTNFVAQDGILYYIDFECNPYSQEWDFENWGWKYWHRTAEFEAAFGK